MDIDYLKVTITVVIAVLGWLVGHHFTKKRNTSDKRRDVVEHLIETYRTLTIVIFARPTDESVDLHLEKVISNIQLFGTADHIELVHQLVERVSEGSTIFGRADAITQEHLDSFLPLIDSLRKELRNELELKEVTDPFAFVRSEYFCVKD